MPQEMRDLIIIGTGPAGLAAALTAQNRGLDFEIFGQADLSAKITKAPKVHNFLGLPDVSGRDLAAALQKQAEAAGIKIRPERIGAVYSMGDSLSVQVGQDFESARAVILASGLAAVKAIPGEDELTGQGVSTCATCDACCIRAAPSSRSRTAEPRRAKWLFSRRSAPASSTSPSTKTTRAEMMRRAAAPAQACQSR